MSQSATSVAGAPPMCAAYPRRKAPFSSSASTFRNPSSVAENALVVGSVPGRRVVDDSGRAFAFRWSNGGFPRCVGIGRGPLSGRSSGCGGIHGADACRESHECNDRQSAESAHCSNLMLPATVNDRMGPRLRCDGCRELYCPQQPVQDQHNPPKSILTRKWYALQPSMSQRWATFYFGSAEPGLIRC
ncbi:hypothetical protein ABIE33_006532 [Ensifer sp. 4252]